jgi:hypothetical protein
MEQPTTTGAIVHACCVLVCNGGLSVAFAVYGFANPDLANQVAIRIENGEAADIKPYHCSYVE